MVKSETVKNIYGWLKHLRKESPVTNHSDTNRQADAQGYKKYVVSSRQVVVVCADHHVVLVSGFDNIMGWPIY